MREMVPNSAGLLELQVKPVTCTHATCSLPSLLFITFHLFKCQAPHVNSCSLTSVGSCKHRCLWPRQRSSWQRGCFGSRGSARHHCTHTTRMKLELKAFQLQLEILPGKMWISWLLGRPMLQGKKWTLFWYNCIVFNFHKSMELPCALIPSAHGQRFAYMH